MNRARFLKSIISNGLLLTSPILKRSEERKLVRVLLDKQYVAGFQYADGMEVKDNMKVGDNLDLIREPENKHDAKAVAVYWKTKRIGYVPMSENKIPNHFLQEGLCIRASIDKLNAEARPWHFCKIGIYLLYPKELMRNA